MDILIAVLVIFAVVGVVNTGYHAVIGSRKMIREWRRKRAFRVSERQFDAGMDYISGCFDHINTELQRLNEKMQSILDLVEVAEDRE